MTKPDMTLLAIDSLSAALGKQQVLTGIDLAVEAGEFVGLIGPNGAGKSTLLKASLGLVDHSGQVRINGHDLQRLSAADRALQVSYLPQEREVHWPLSVETVVGLGCAYQKAPMTHMPAALRARIDQAMARMDIGHLRARPANALSGGERARVLLARLLAQETPLLLADEPTAGLDPAHQLALMACFAALAREGRAVVACLHEIALAARWCSRIVVVDQGAIVADGAPRTVLSDQLIHDVYGVDVYRAETDAGLIVVPTHHIGPKVGQWGNDDGET